MTAYVLNAEYIRLANLFRDPRTITDVPNTDAIRVEPHPMGGAYIVATNGKRLIVAYDKNAIVPGPANIRVPVALVEHLQGDTILDRVLFIDTEDETYVKRTCAAKPLKAAPTEGVITEQGDYPKWRNLLVADDGKTLRPFWPSVLNANDLKLVTDLYPALREWRQVQFMRRGDDRDAYLFFPWRPQMYVVLSPFLDLIDLELPQWLSLSGEIDF